MATMNEFIVSLRYGNLLLSLFRITAGALMIVSGAFKAFDPVGYGEMVASFGIVSPVASSYVAVVIPFMELVAGVFLLLGYKIRAASVVLLSVTVILSVAMIWSLVAGMTVSCECAHLKRLGIVIDDFLVLRLLLRNVLLLLVGILLYNASRHPFSIDSWHETHTLKNL